MEKEPVIKPKEFSDEAKPFKRRMDQLNISGDIQKSIMIMDDVAVKVQELQQRYGDDTIRKHELFHVVSGSTPIEGVNFLGLDLPEGEFKALIEELENKYGSV